MNFHASVIKRISNFEKTGNLIPAKLRNFDMSKLKEKSE
jgi:hypothetical protein